MKLKKAFISNIDIIQVSNFATVSSVTNSPQVPKESNLSQQQEVRLTNNIISVISQTVDNTKNITKLTQTRNTKDNQKVKQDFLNKITKNLDFSIISSPGKELEIKNRLRDYDLVTEYNNELIKVKNELNINKYPKLMEKAPDRILTPYKTYINNDPGTSKVLSLLLEKYQQTFKIKAELYDKLADEQKTYVELQRLIVIFTAISAVSGFFGLFIAPFAVVAVGAGIIALVLSAFKELRKSKINVLKKQLELLDQIKEMDFTNIIVDGSKLSVDIISLTTNALIKRLKVNGPLSKASKYISRGWGILSVGYDFYSLIKSKEELDEEMNVLNKYNEQIIEIKDMRAQYGKQWDNFKKLNKIVVISETPQNFAYKSGGTGGTNMFFKRLIDGKIFSRKEMLAMSKHELESYNLIKVKRTVSKNNQKYSYEYIRSKNSNNLLEDNLG